MYEIKYMYENVKSWKTRQVYTHVTYMCHTPIIYYFYSIGIKISTAMQIALLC